MPRRAVGPIADRPLELRGLFHGLEMTVWWRGKWKRCGPVSWWVRTAAGLQPAWLLDGEEDVPKPFDYEDATELVALGCDAGKWRMLYPELASWLCDGTYSDKKPIGMTQLTLRRKGSEMLAQLKIQDQGGLKCEVSDTNMDRALAALEALLASAKVPWVRDEYPLGGAAKKKK